MNPVEFAQAVQKLTQYIKHDFPRVVGVEGTNYYKDSFQKEGFTDKSFVRWQEVKRRLRPAKSAMDSKKILTQSGELGDSIRWDADYNKVTFETDKPYAQAQNEGTQTAGRNRNTTIPKRQFIGQSEQLNTALKKELENHLNAIFKP